MLISHHPPTQYDRTFQIGGVRVCARCSSLVVGVIGMLVVLTNVAKMNTPSPLMLGLLTELVLVAGIFVFVENEIGRRKSNNIDRILFGVALGGLLVLSWCADIWLFATLILSIIAGQFLTAALMQHHGVLDRFVNEYLEGSISGSRAMESNHQAQQCGHSSCPCHPARPHEI